MADWKQQSLQLWNKISKRQRYTMAGVAALLMAALLGWSYLWSGRPDMVPLFTGMEAKDAGEVAAKLKEMKIQFEPQETPKGTAILVPTKDVYSTRLELASQGLPRGNKGFEIFEDTKLGVTEFQNKVNYLQALQGELTRTIEQLDEVEKARVHIVLPEDSLYKKNEKPATASIMVKLKRETELSKDQVKGIENLTAHSIQGLQAENITIVSQNGKILNGPEDDEETLKEQMKNITISQLEMTRKVQDRLQKNVQSLLDQALGEGKAFVRVSVELDFDKKQTDRQTFAPVVDDSGIIRSSQDTTETYQGTSNTAGGPAGTASNIPGYVATNGTGQSNYEKKDSIRNYEINETKEKISAAPGAIRRLTIGVLVDAELGTEQQEGIARAVGAAVGLNPSRGDTVSVEMVPFSKEMLERLENEERMAMEKEQQMMWLQIGIVVLLLIIFGGLFYLWYRKKKQLADAAAAEAVAAEEAKRAEEQRALQEMIEAQKNEIEALKNKAVEEAAAAVELAQRAAEAEGLSENGEPVDEKEKVVELTDEEKQHMAERKAVDDMLTQRPEDFAQLLKSWLTDEE